MATNPVRPGPRRSSALFLCYWTYGIAPNIFRIEITVWTLSFETVTGGFNVSNSFEARVSKEGPDGADILCVYRLSNAIAAANNIANGLDPLLAVAAEPASNAMQKLEQSAGGLAAIYQSIILNTATPEILQSVKGPRL